MEAGATQGNHSATLPRGGNPPEQYWTGRINALWPRGWNSCYPGRPVSRVGLRARRFAAPEGGVEDPLDAPQPAQWAEHWRRDPVAAKYMSRLNAEQQLTAPEDTSVTSLYVGNMEPQITQDDLK